MVANLQPYPKFKATYLSGTAVLPLVGGKLYTYAAGTTTPLATYTDQGAGTPNANPVVLDANGEADVWFADDTAYKLKLTDSTGTQLWLVDNIQAQAGLRVDLANSSDVTKGDALVAVKQPLSNAAARTQHQKNAEYLTVTDFTGVDATGVADSTTGFQNALTACTGKTLRVPAGTYKLTSQLTNDGTVNVVGDGALVTILSFQPTADGSCLKVTAGASQAVEVEIRGLQFYSPDTTYTKVALDLADISSCVIDDIYVNGAGTGAPSAPYWKGGTGSTGILTRGRETSNFSNLRVIAQRPLYISNNPNASSQILEDVDHWNFHNCYFHGDGSNYCITVQDGVGMSHCTFDGYQAWVAGKGGFYMNDNRGTGGGWLPSRNISFNNVRVEQQADATAWGIYCSTTSGAQQVVVSNTLIGRGSNGLSFNKIERLSLSNVTTAVAGTALSVTGATGDSVIELENCIWDSAGTFNLPNYVPSHLSAYRPGSYGGPSTATFIFTSTAPFANWTCLGKNGTEPACPADTTEDILATISVPANILGPMGCLRVRTLWQVSNNANVKTARVRLGGIGGTDYLNLPLTGIQGASSEVIIFNQNDVAHQVGSAVGGYSSTGGFGTTANVVTRSTVDTSAATTLVITGQKATAGDSLSLVAWVVEALAG